MSCFKANKCIYIQVCSHQPDIAATGIVDQDTDVIVFQVDDVAIAEQDGTTATSHTGAVLGLEHTCTKGQTAD